MLLYSFTLLLFLSIRAVRSDTEPAPIVVNPSGNFRGLDGNWSTFALGVGTPPQLLELLPSTKVPETWVVLTEGCTKDDLKNCSDTRGGLFNYAESSTWTLKHTYALVSEVNLGYTTNSDNGAYGWDNLTWKSSSDADVNASHIVIAGIATKDFYLGVLGLAGRPITFEDSSSSLPSLITSLKDQGQIQSQSYGYTAGAFYNNAPGSLTIGGYDASRSMPNGVSFNFSSQLERQLTVAIQGISVSNSLAGSQVLTSAIFALVDSTVPHLWLPVSVCYAFEQAFGIEFDPITNLYLVNDTQHEALLKQNAELTISLAANTDGGPIVNITLPYASLDLEIGPPLVKSQSRYFPLRRAKDETQFTLGRVLLQEAFIIVDYDQKAFSISQAQYTEGAPSNIVVTTSINGNNTTDTNGNGTDTSGSSSPVKSTTHTSSHGIGTGAIAGIVAGIVVLVIAAAGFCFWKLKYRKSATDKERKSDAELPDNVEPKGIQEAYGKRRLSDSSEHGPKKGTSVNVNEVRQTPPPEAAELEGTRLSRAEMGLDQSRAELPSPDPFRPELESPSLGIIRSGLSTPEPSELSTSDPSLVPELKSQDMRHELAGSNRNSRHRPLSFRNNSMDSDVISPQDSASIRPGIHARKGSDDTIPTPTSPISPQPQRPSLRQNQRRHSGFQRPQHTRLNSQSSHDTFETRINENSSPPPHQQGSPSPLASPPLGSQPSPSLSALNSPTLPHHQMGYTGPPTPGFDINENEPLISSQQPRPTRFSENLTSEPEGMTREERPRYLEAERGVVKEEVKKLENLRKDEK